MRPSVFILLLITVSCQKHENTDARLMTEALITGRVHGTISEHQFDQIEGEYIAIRVIKSDTLANSYAFTMAVSIAHATDSIQIIKTRTKFMQIHSLTDTVALFIQQRENELTKWKSSQE